MTEQEQLNVDNEGLPASAWDFDLPGMPVESHGCLAATDGRRIYVAGGTSSSGHIDLVQVFDTSTMQWSEPFHLPWARRLMAGGMMERDFFLFLRGACCVLHTETGEVEGPHPLDLLTPYQQAGKAVGADNGMIVLGGICADDRTSKRVVHFDIGSRKETRLAPMNIGRAHHEAVACGDYVYVFGGKINGYSEVNQARSCTDTIERYDVKSDTWQIMDIHMPIPRMVAVLAKIDRYALLFDGQPRNDALQMSSVWVFDLEKERFLPCHWASPYAAWSGACVQVNGTIYLAGGNQLVYEKKPPPGDFAMVHRVVNRFMAFTPPELPPGTERRHNIPDNVY